MSASREIIDLLEARSSSGRDAFQITKTLFAKIITILQRRFGIGHSDAELLLANVIREHEDVLFNALRGRVHLDDAEDAVRLCLEDDEYERRELAFEKHAEDCQEALDSEFGE
jgi:hypothetical protein